MAAVTTPGDVLEAGAGGSCGVAPITPVAGA